MPYGNAFHQCCKCGVTRALDKLQSVHRRDKVLKLEEDVFACADEIRCAYLKLQFDELAAAEAKLKKRAMSAPFTGKGGRPKGKS